MHKLCKNNWLMSKLFYVQTDKINNYIGIGEPMIHAINKTTRQDKQEKQPKHQILPKSKSISFLI